jgi:hypothetical protein
MYPAFFENHDGGLGVNPVFAQKIAVRIKIYPIGFYPGVFRFGQFALQRLFLSSARAAPLCMDMHDDGFARRQSLLKAGVLYLTMLAACAIEPDKMKSTVATIGKMISKYAWLPSRLERLIFCCESQTPPELQQCQFLFDQKFLAIICSWHANTTQLRSHCGCRMNRKDGGAAIFTSI